MALAFKNFKKKITKVSKDYLGGYNRALDATEGVVENGWYKLNEDAVTEGVIGSINALNKQIDELESKIKSYKSQLRALKSALDSAGNAYCESSYHSCNTPEIWASIAAVHISTIESELEVLDAQLVMLHQMKTLYGFIKPDNMYFKES